VSESKYSIETICRVYDDHAGVYVEVGPDGDIGGLVEIRTEGKSTEYYGPVRLVMEAEAARALAKALISVVKAIEASK
jgi:hypothetical protein